LRCGGWTSREGGRTSCEEAGCARRSGSGSRTGACRVAGSVDGACRVSVSRPRLGDWTTGKLRFEPPRRGWLSSGRELLAGSPLCGLSRVVAGSRSTVGCLRSGGVSGCAEGSVSVRAGLPVTTASRAGSDGLPVAG
jgi:hypothetical protein